jgi:hypothetical protein
MHRIVTLGLVGALVGCSSSSGGSSYDFGPEPDYTAIRAIYDHPTGTFAAGSETTIFGAYTQQQQAGDNYGSVGSLQSGGTTTQSVGLHILGGSGATDFCPAISQGGSGSCSCPAGGTLYYDLSGLASLQQQSGAINATAKVAFAGCGVNTVTVNGHEFLHVESAVSPPTAQSLFEVLDAHLTATPPPLSIDMDLFYDQGKWWVSVNVNDGQVVVSGDGTWDGTTGSGTISVKDKSDTWSCTATNGHGTCTSGSGQTRTF